MQLLYAICKTSTGHLTVEEFAGLILNIATRMLPLKLKNLCVKLNVNKQCCDSNIPSFEHYFLFSTMSKLLISSFSFYIAALLICLSLKLNIKVS